MLPLESLSFGQQNAVLETCFRPYDCLDGGGLSSPKWRLVAKRETATLCHRINVQDEAWYQQAGFRPELTDSLC
jgi:hypothetical protein